MNRNRKLLKNSLVYAIGNFASKILNFILLPIYIIYLNADNFGYIDLLITVSSLLIPVITLQIVDAGYRFMLDKEREDDIYSIVTNGSFIYFIGYLLFIIVCFCISRYFKIQYSALFIAYIIFVYFIQFLQQLCRGMRRNSVYAAVGVIVTLVQGISNIIFIVLFHMKSESLLLAPIIASVFGIFYLQRTTNIIKYINIKYLSKSFCLKMAAYSAPLCAHSICWWIITSAGTYFLTYYTKTTTLSGIYALANKFPLFLSMLNSIFLLAWQESAVEEYDSKDAQEYFQKMYNAFLSLQITVLIVLLPMVNIYFAIFQKSDFVSAKMYVPWLLLVNLISSAISYVSIIYNVIKKTRSVMKSSMIGMMVSLLLNLILIPWFKVWGCIISSSIGLTIILLFRVMDTRQYMRIKLDKWNLSKRGMILFIYIVMYYIWGWRGQVLMLIIGAVAFILFNKLIIKSGLSTVLKKGRNSNEVC